MREWKIQVIKNEGVIECRLRVKTPDGFLQDKFTAGSIAEVKSQLAAFDELLEDAGMLERPKKQSD